MIGIGYIKGKYSDLSEAYLPSEYTLIKKSGKNVTKTKNKLLKELINKDCDELFLIEDHIIIKNKEVFQKFVDVAKLEGFEAMIFSGDERSNQKPSYYEDPFVDYWPYPAHGFSYYTKKAVDKVGYMDEKFPPDTWEFAEYFQRIGNAGLTSTFGLFPSIKNDRDYLDTVPGSIDEMIREDLSRKEEMEKGLFYWQAKDPSITSILPETKKKGFQMKRT